MNHGFETRYDNASAQMNAVPLPQTVPLTEEANRALAAAHELHSQLDALESALFGPASHEVAGSAPSAAPIFADQIRETRQRLESAGSRLALLRGRL